MGKFNTDAGGFEVITFPVVIVIQVVAGCDKTDVETGVAPGGGGGSVVFVNTGPVGALWPGMELVEVVLAVVVTLAVVVVDLGAEITVGLGILEARDARLAAGTCLNASSFLAGWSN